MPFQIHYDKLTDVLSIHEPEKAVTFGPSPHDNHLLLERDANGRVIGIEVLGASTVKVDAWADHPDRALVPKIISAFLIGWCLAHKA